MPATLWNQFIGGFGASRSPTMDAEQCWNLYPATIESQTNAKQKVLFGTPGLTRRLSVSTTSCRGMFSQDGLTWAVVGATLYELNLTANTATSRGTILDDGNPVSFACNGRTPDAPGGGNQLLIVGGGEVKVLNLTTNVLTAPIALPLTNAPVQTAFLDGYFFLLEQDTTRWWFSAQEDGTSWDGLDSVGRLATSDNFVGLAVLRDRVWLWGSESTEIYYDSGDADTPFLPYPGAITHQGLVGPWAWTTDGQSMYWLSQNDQGQGEIVRGVEGQSQPISTDAIAFQIAQATRLDDAEAFCYQQEGHTFVGWTFPSCANCGLTLVYDTKEQLWHQRGSWDATLGLFFRWRVRGIASTEDGLICGDYSTGDLYTLSLDAYTENGALIRRVRRAPYLSPEAAWAFIDQIELGVQVGVGLTTGQGSDPTASMRVSRDAAMTWAPWVSVPLGAMGQYLTRAVAHRLGRVRLDRLVLEVAVTDPVKIAFGPGLWLRLSQGSGAL